MDRECSVAQAVFETRGHLPFEIYKVKFHEFHEFSHFTHEKWRNYVVNVMKNVSWGVVGTSREGLGNYILLTAAMWGLSCVEPNEPSVHCVDPMVYPPPV